MSGWKDTRKPLTHRGVHQVTDAKTFEHQPTDCPCEPWTLTVNPDGAVIRLIMHRPATQRGHVKERPRLSTRANTAVAKTLRGETA